MPRSLAAAPVLCEGLNLNPFTLLSHPSPGYTFLESALRCYFLRMSYTIDRWDYIPGISPDSQHDPRGQAGSKSLACSDSIQRI